MINVKSLMSLNNDNRILLEQASGKITGCAGEYNYKKNIMKQKTDRQKLIKQLDDLVRKIVFMRDNYTCQYSGKKDNLQISHYITRSNTHLRFNLDNLTTLNGGVHLFLFHKRPHKYRDWLIRKIGLAKVEWLEMQDRIYCKPIYVCDLKLLKADLLEKLAYYKKGVLMSLRKILEEYRINIHLCHTCINEDTLIKRQREFTDQAHQEILALLPKKKEIKELKSKPCPYSDKIKCCTMQDYARNQCIDDIKEVLNG